MDKDFEKDRILNASASENSREMDAVEVQNTSDIIVVGNDSSSTGIKVGEFGEMSDAALAEQSEQLAPVALNMDDILSDAASQPYVEDAAAESIEEITTRTLSPGRIVAKRFFRSKLSITGLVILVILFAFSFLGPLFKDVCPFIWGEQEKADLSNSVTYTYTNEVNITKDDGNAYSVFDENSDNNTVYIVTYSTQTNYLPPSKTHLFGTDDKGFDVFSRLMYGGRISLTIGFVVIILETFLGVLLGGISGYFGKWVDQVIMRIVDIFNCVPTMPMLMIVGVALEGLNLYGVERLYIMMAMMTLFGWAGTARLVRGQILSLREQDFMLSAEASGLTVGRKIFKHLIPNVIPQLIVSMTLGLGGIILTEATLGYLGIGLPTQYATWGNMINAATNNMVLTNYPNLWITPGVLIVLAVLGFNFVGDGLRDAFDPKARR